MREQKLLSFDWMIDVSPKLLFYDSFDFLFLSFDYNSSVPKLKRKPRLCVCWTENGREAGEKKEQNQNQRRENDASEHKFDFDKIYYAFASFHNVRLWRIAHRIFMYQSDWMTRNEVEIQSELTDERCSVFDVPQP